MNTDALKIRSKLFLVRCSLERLGLPSGVAIIDETIAFLDAMPSEPDDGYISPSEMTPDDICRVMNKHGHDGATDWRYDGHTGVWSFRPSKPTVVFTLFEARAIVRAYVAEGIEEEDERGE